MRRPAVAISSRTRLCWSRRPADHGKDGPRGVTRLATLLLALTVTAGCSGSAVTADQSSGGLTSSPATGWAGSFDVGDVLTDGWNTALVTTTDEIEIIKVTPRLRGTTVEPLGVSLAGTDRRAGLVGQVWHQWPADDKALGTVVPAEGATVVPDERTREWGLEFLLGYEIVAPGRTEIYGFDVEYMAAGKKQRVHIKSYIALCSPKDNTGPEDCAQVNPDLS